MSEYSGNIRDLPVVTGGHFIENSTKKIVFGPDPEEQQRIDMIRPLIM